jgi:3-oxoacyl-[acyl-carrier protein] reductase
VAIAELNEDAGRSAVEELKALGPVFFCRTDVADEASTVVSVEEAIKHFGRADILVNNAGLYGDWDSSDQSFEYLEKMFRINLHGSWLMARALAPHLVAQGSGRIINVASIGAYKYRPMQRPTVFNGLPSFCYQQSKWGVVGLTKYLAGYLGTWGITANCIAPGVTFTEATEKQIPPDRVGLAMNEQLISGYIQPRNVAEAAVYLASDESRYVTGHVIAVAGGQVFV